MQRHWITILVSFLSFLFVSGCAAKEPQPPTLTKCLNIGNSLEAPKDQPWDVPMDSSYFSTIKQAGFQTIRLPVRFSDYTASSDEDYRLDEAFVKKIDMYIKEALGQELTVILDFHHFMDIMENPALHKMKLISIWQQLSERYKNYSDDLVFEILNEPQKNLDSESWNSILQETVTAIRKNDKKHFLIVGGANYNSIDALLNLRLPEDDRLIATFHYYEPNEVTFQGNPYHYGYENLSGIGWNATDEELKYLQERFNMAKNWANENKVSLFLGEFGISKTAPEQTRLNWTRSVAKEASLRDIDYGYWEFASGFGVYDLQTKTWNQEMVDAILDPQGK
ncbi:glycoside hydrolase family 5 protein [Scatolibacter rhodanostii]|uniref:glycoside hydrolase family 5 protein n=1 Tax=Scatolibacter rhodanostii TaxID=2014781 RepID=UPI0013565A0A|nr:glycoside hydrolase family 5 protein [Scatolibacter rhodanostii]